MMRGFALAFLGLIFQTIIITAFMIALIVEMFYPKGFSIIFCVYWPFDCYCACSDCFHETCPYERVTKVHIFLYYNINIYNI